MRSTLVTSLLMMLVLTALTGVVYPAAVTLLARIAFAEEAGGSLIRRHGRLVGSVHLGQPFHSPAYFWGRPSATSPEYNAAASSGSNLGPTNSVLADSIASRIRRLRAADPENLAPVPIDLVTASGSGLDPHVSPAAAEYQVGRVARARFLDEAQVRALVRRHVEPRQFGILGEPRVNVLRLNLALDALRPER